MRACVLATLLLAGSGVVAEAGPMVLTHPAARFSASRFEIEYVRPWAGLPVQQGRVALSLPVGARSAIGVEGSGVESATTERVELGLVVRIGATLRAEAGMREIRVAGFEPWRDPTGRMDLRVGAGAFGFGLSAAWEPAAGADRPALLRRESWLSLRHGAGDLTIARRIAPWQPDPIWVATLRMQLHEAATVAARWSPVGIALALEWSAGPLLLTSSSQCTGARAGGFGFRIAEPR